MKMGKDEHGQFPGDELILNPGKTVTHSIIIHASCKQVWPWLVQMGAGRAGWYSYDRIDNGGNPSAKKIIAELQHVGAGDIMPAIPQSRDSFIVREILPERALILVVPVQTSIQEPDNLRRMTGPLRVSWALILEPVGQGKTKLISHARIASDWLRPSEYNFGASKSRTFIEHIYALLARMPWFLMAPIAFTGHYLMESRMLSGIKRRAEGTAVN